jgi:RNA polymerase sigma-70 factor (ECF subfamily)
MSPDRALVEAVVRDGDEVAFRELYRRHTPRLYPLVLRVVGGAEMDAEDVVQETWIRATAGMRRFRGDSSFATWLTAIGLNAARDHLRRRGRWGAMEDVDEVEVPVPPAPHGSAWISSARSRSSRPVAARFWCCTTSKVSPTRRLAGSSASPWAHRKVSSSPPDGRRGICCQGRRR